ncbi:MAG: selenide, water dikinase SelD [Saprospiraceae bacterium]|nr:selenide, water dikinase SelD [Lewinella sp.]
MQYRLTEFSHGAGCGCKLSPSVLSEILSTSDQQLPSFAHLLVGNETKDDAAVVALDDHTAIVSTTDFFMPIVDDPFDFGAIAATNAISDIYAMGAEPLMAIAILGWPIDKIPPEVAGQVVSGGRSVCTAAGIPLAGGHSIDAPEPIFGLAVTGKVPIADVKRNQDGKVGDLLYLTKPLGIGIVTTAQKRKLAEPEDLDTAKRSMLTLNTIGQSLGRLPYVHALTDVTGFGLAGHVLEVCEATQIGAEIFLDRLPVFGFVDKYLAQGCTPGGTHRNWKAYGSKIRLATSDQNYTIIADPQTSGGLLVSVDPSYKSVFEAEMQTAGLDLQPIGRLVKKDQPEYLSVLSSW